MPASVLHFGSFQLDESNARLLCDGRPLELAPKAFELLAFLARRPGELVLKDTLLDAVWGRRFISEGVIKTVVSELRAVLQDDARAPRWIETVPRRGYRFVGAVTAAAPAAHAVPAAAGNLPPVLAPMIGREADLATLVPLLAAQRLVTVAGPAGIGKTRLTQAAAAAQRGGMADGVWFVELAPLVADAAGLAPDALLRSSIVQALQLAPAAAASDTALAAALQPLAALLVLDNAEHLIDALAPLVSSLLQRAPMLRVLVSSQEPLRVAGEQVYRLPPLSVPAMTDDADAAQLMSHGAVRLFVERVGSRLPGFQLGPQQQRAVAAICRALDGLPLALELAAARVPLLGVHGLAERLADAEADPADPAAAAGASPRLQLLTQGERNAPPHQRTLRDALDWSHALLSEPQRRVFRRLSVFRGALTLEAAQAVCADEALPGLDVWGVLDALDALVEKSLLQAPLADAPVPRFRQLESVRAYAFERLAEAGEVAWARDRHLAATCAYWERADARSLGDPALAWLARHGAELDNLRAALRWACAGAARAAAALQLVGHTGILWMRMDLGGEGRVWCETVRASAEASAHPALRGRFELAVGVLGAYAHAYTPAETLAAAERARKALDPAADPVRCYLAAFVGWHASLRMPGADPQSWSAAMAALEQPGWSELLTRFGRAARAYDGRAEGRFDAYLAYCMDELARYQRLGAVAEGWTIAQGLMLAEHDLGRPDAALRVGREALAEIRAAGRLRLYPAFLSLWLTMLAENGDTAAVRQAMAEAVPVVQGAGAPWMLHLAWAWLAAHEGRVEVAAQLLGWLAEAERLRHRSGAGNGPYIDRTCAALQARLAGRLGAEQFTRCHAAGAALGEAAALQRALEVPASAGRPG